jgi:hypothetical protein
VNVPATPLVATGGCNTAGVTSRLRVTALIAAAALALHQLRYLPAGDHGGSAAGHSYLPFAGLAAALLLAAAGAQLVRVIARRRAGAAARELPFRLAWPLAALALFTTFAGQELLEGMLANGRAEGLPAVFGAGGWVAVPLAVALGALVAAALAGARAVVRAAAARRAPLAARRAPRLGRALSRAAAPARGLIAAHLAGRAPPPAC